MSHLLRITFLLPSRRLFTTSTSRPAFSVGPAPPRLPPKEQEEYERLQRNSTGAFSTPRPSVTVNQSSTSTTNPSAQSPPRVNQSPASAPESTPETTSKADSISAEEIEIASVNARIEATGKGEEVHPDIRRGAKPEFEGDVNPLTGEVGGPKNEPLRWGSTGERGDWSYNGRVTDF